MNRQLQKLILLYAKRAENELKDEFKQLNKPDLTNLIVDLLQMYITDVNSSTLRELVTVELAGYERSGLKRGPNGKRTSEGAEIYVEAKPKNAYWDNSKGEISQKLNGAGNFSDYTPERFNKDKTKNLHILVSGFTEGILMFVLEFPFNYLEAQLQKELKKEFPDGKRLKGKYGRNVQFSYTHYMNKGTDFTLIYISSFIDEYKKYFVKGFLSWLISLKQIEKK